MTYRHIAGRSTAIIVLALGLSACAAARRPDPTPIVDTTPPDAKLLAPEFHGARVGRDHLRGSLPSE